MNNNINYCFITLFRADKSASGLAFRMPLLWKSLSEKHDNIYLIINKSLYKKTLSNLNQKEKNNIYIIPEFMGFKATSFLYTPLLIIFLLFFKKINKFHLSVGGAYFINFLEKIRKLTNKKILIHTSIGSKNLEMITGGNKKSRYYKLHKNLLSKADKIDCLYSPNGFPEHRKKCIQSPGSFSWKYSSEKIKKINLPLKKTNNILFSGSLIKQKNYDLAINSYILFCNKQTKSFDLTPKLIISAPFIHQELKTEVDEFNKKKKGEIIFTNYNEIDSLLKSSFVFLSLQDFDNYPSQSLIEAMANGCTIIATNTGETKKIVKEKIGNYIIEKDINMLAATLIKIFNNTNNLSNFENRNFILKNHTIENYSQHFFNNFIKNG
ncbi:glycosyltransferase [Advenella sp. EE-W14]|uniref:glycosyltransferase n=1 Tax=Advenella sp. EE-W14 TaxID=2722705 RepID=UPI00145FB4E5|nr:glycosyltransferase [Advenella sp. EE-W14]